MGMWVAIWWMSSVGKEARFIVLVDGAVWSCMVVYILFAASPVDVYSSEKQTFAIALWLVRTVCYVEQE